MAMATYVAIALNLTVAAIALALTAIPARYDATAVPAPTESGERAAGAWAVYLTIALSGMSALGAEVVWTRLLSLILGGTVYTFSLILAVFLIGLGIGSSLGAMLARRAASARVALGVCQWLLTAAIAWTAVVISESLPYWPIVPGLSPSPWYTLQLDLVAQPLGRPAAGVPVGSELSAGAGGGRLGRPGPRAAGRRGLCSQHNWRHRGRRDIQPVAGPRNRHGRRRAGADRGCRGGRIGGLFAPALARALIMRLAGGAVLAAAMGAAGWLASGVTPVQWPIVAFGRNAPTWLARSAPGIVKDVPKGLGYPDYYCNYVGEGTNVSVAVTMTRQGVRSFHGAGKIQASTHKTDMQLQRMLGHLPALVHKKPESVLVVACGAGITAGSFLVHPDVKRVVICDIEPLVPTIVAPMFGTENYHVVDDIAHENPHTVNGKQVEVVYDDGRHFLRTTDEKFDIITSDPIDPWVKGCAALNTVEYYQMCRDHLNPGGGVSLWIPFYESNLETTKSVIATFFQVFPHGIVWSNDRQGVGYDAILFGQVEPTVIDVSGVQERLDRPDHKLVKQSLREVGFGEPRTGLPVTPEGIDLLATYAGQAPLLKEWMQGAQINTDRNLRLQYLAGMWLNSKMGEQIRSSILEQYRFPDPMFVGSPEGIRILKLALFRVGRL